MNKLIFIYLAAILFAITETRQHPHNVQKRDDSAQQGSQGGLSGGGETGIFGTSLIDSLAKMISNFKETLLGPPKQGALNDVFVPNSQVASENKVKGPSILQAIGFCAINQIDCDFIGCLATNFKNNKMTASMKKAGKVALDPPLRRALLDDPNILKTACEGEKMNDFMCNAFGQFLGLMEKIDPPAHHVFDESRDKRAAELPSKSNSFVALPAPPSPNVGSQPIVNIVIVPSAQSNSDNRQSNRQLPAVSQVNNQMPNVLAVPPTSARAAQVASPQVAAPVASSQVAAPVASSQVAAPVAPPMAPPIAAVVPAPAAPPSNVGSSKSANDQGTANTNSNSATSGAAKSGASGGHDYDTGSSGGKHVNKGANGGSVVDYYDHDGGSNVSGGTAAPGGDENAQQNCFAQRQAAVQQRDALRSG